MLNNLLIAFDRNLKNLDAVHKRCKKFSPKVLGPITVFDICCSVVSFLGVDKLEDIKVLKTVYYDTFVALCPSFVDFLLTPKAKLFLILAAIVLSGIWLLRLFFRYPALLISHSTMGHNLNDIAENLQKEFYFKRQQIECRIKNTSDIENAIKIQDDALISLEKNNWRATIFYYGVCHTPLIFRLGYQMGQTRKMRFLHRLRPTENSQEFDELPPYVEGKAAIFKSDAISEENYNTSSHEMIVAIGTTYEIKKEDFAILDPDNNLYTYIMQVDDRTSMGYDFFNSYQKIVSYADRFIDDIRRICKERNISKIHMVLSTSVPFTFYLAQQMHTNQFPEIIVYHYDLSDERKYPWGIRIKCPNAREAMIWTKAQSAISS